MPGAAGAACDAGGTDAARDAFREELERCRQPIASEGLLRLATAQRQDAWDTAVREGAQLSFEDAIAYALDQQRARSAHAASTT